MVNLKNIIENQIAKSQTLFYLRSYVSLLILIIILWQKMAIAQQSNTSDPNSEKKQTASIAKNKQTLDLHQAENALEKLHLGIHFHVDGHYYQDADLRRLDETDAYSIDLTDDKTTFIVSSLLLQMGFAINDNSHLRADIYKIGLWGHDMLADNREVSGLTNHENIANPFYFSQLYTDVFFFKTDLHYLKIKLGRQHFSLGDANLDFIQSDVLDALVFEYQHENYGNLRWLALDWFGSNSNINDIDHYNFINQNPEAVDGFDGDVNTLRTGLIYQTPKIVNFITKIYGYYARFGAVKSGADRSDQGATSNTADNDYNYLVGLRPVYSLENIKLHADLAYSGGIDRRGKYYKDIQNDGFAYGFGFSVKPRPIVLLAANYFYAQGGRYNEYGEQTSHGFVSFKGDQVGALIGNGNYGLHPSAFTDFDGIDDNPFERDRKTGSWIFHLALELEMVESLLLQLGFWHINDTNISQLVYKKKAGDLNGVNQIQQKFGQSLGQEYDAALAYNVSNNLIFIIQGSLFNPGSYYQLSGLTPDVPHGSDKAWGMRIASQLRYGSQDNNDNLRLTQLSRKRQFFEY